MTAQIYQFVHAEEALEYTPAHEHQASPDLAVLPPELIAGLFDRLSAEDKRIVLQEMAIPVACLPNYTMYGVAGSIARKIAAAAGRRIVAEIDPTDLKNAVRFKLGAEILAHATFSLLRKFPHLSSYHRLSVAQFLWFCVLTLIVGLAYAFLDWSIFCAAASFLGGLFFLSIVALRALCVLEIKNPQKHSAPPLSDEDLPVYSVLVPVFREVKVLNQLIRALMRLHYPEEKLDIKIIVEQNDLAMHKALGGMRLPDWFDVIVVPCGSPQTKPRALNYALQFARGSLLTIFDAEDVPEPDQLRKAAAQFAIAPADRACLQAELAFYNSNENWLTRQFTVEYAVLFKLLLPAFVREGLPLPLGGTSNHFRTAILRRLEGWDPYNVTEDADLGFRLSRCGFTTSVLDSVTYEEATLVLGNWFNQRARWLKGFMQTWLVHMRHPIKLWREVGLYGWFALQAITLGIVISALFHPVLFGYAIYVLVTGHLMDGTDSMFLTVVMGLNIVVLSLGSAVSILAGAKGLKRKNISGWWFILATMPVYWILISIAGWMAIWQLVCKPHHWNKTSHGHSRFQLRL